MSDLGRAYRDEDGLDVLEAGRHGQAQVPHCRIDVAGADGRIAGMVDRIESKLQLRIAAQVTEE